MCLCVFMNGFLSSGLEFLDGVLERFGPADVAGKDDIRQAGEFRFGSQFPNGDTGKNLAEHQCAFDAQALGREVAGGDAALGDQVSADGLRAGTNQFNPVVAGCKASPLHGRPLGRVRVVWQAAEKESPVGGTLRVPNPLTE